MRRREKVNVILDMNNENTLENKYLVAYLLANSDIFNIQCITIAPSTVCDKSKLENNKCNNINYIYEIIDLMNMNLDDKIIVNDTESSIIEKVIKNTKTYIIATGNLTNISNAIKKEPKIINKIEIIWLGMNGFMYEDNTESNFINNPLAVKSVFKSKALVTLIPRKNVASHMNTSIYEIEHYFKNKNEISKMLYKDAKLEIEEQNKLLVEKLLPVAYIINNEWFEVENIYCPKFIKDNRLKERKKGNTIKLIKYMDRDKILEDFFSAVNSI